MKPTIEIMQNDDGQWWWRVKAAGNNEILCHSEQYKRFADAARGVRIALNLVDEPQEWHMVAMQSQELVRSYDLEVHPK